VGLATAGALEMPVYLGAILKDDDFKPEFRPIPYPSLKCLA
jgi:hypothetical protein